MYVIGLKFDHPLTETKANLTMKNLPATKKLIINHYVFNCAGVNQYIDIYISAITNSCGERITNKIIVQ